MKREPKKGDYYLQPYAGALRSILVQAVSYHKETGHWYVRWADGHESLVLLSSCHRCSPSRAARILRKVKT